MRGKEYEDEAVSYLRRKGYRILKRNYRTRFGEIDVIARLGKTLVFVEVKGGRGDPRFRVNERKLRRLELAINDYLSKADLTYDEIRLDVVEVTSKGIRHMVGINL